MNKLHIYAFVRWWRKKCNNLTTILCHNKKHPAIVLYFISTKERIIMLLMLNNYDNMLPCLPKHTYTHTHKYSSKFAGDDYEFIINILNVLIITQKKKDIILGCVRWNGFWVCFRKWNWNPFLFNNLKWVFGLC